MQRADEMGGSAGADLQPTLTHPRTELVRNVQLPLVAFVITCVLAVPGVFLRISKPGVPGFIRCIASVQPLITWFGANCKTCG